MLVWHISVQVLNILNVKQKETCYAPYHEDAANMWVFLFFSALSTIP